MKKFFFFLGLMLSVWLISSCAKEKSVEKPAETVDMNNFWRFSVGNSVYEGSIDNIAVDNPGGFETLSIDGISIKNSDETFRLVVHGNPALSPGTYSSPDVGLFYLGPTDFIYQSEQTGLTVNILTYDSTTVAGTFSGTVRAADGKTVTVSNGSFHAKR